MCICVCIRHAIEVNKRDYRAWYGLGQTYEILKMPFYSLYYYRKAHQLRCVACVRLCLRVLYGNDQFWPAVQLYMESLILRVSGPMTPGCSWLLANVMKNSRSRLKLKRSGAQSVMFNWAYANVGGANIVCVCVCCSVTGEHIQWVMWRGWRCSNLPSIIIPIITAAKWFVTGVCVLVINTVLCVFVSISRLHEQLNESDDAAQCYIIYIQDIFSCGVSV